MINVFQDLVMRYKNSSLQNKLFLSYFFLIFIPIVALSFFSYEKSSNVIISQTMDIASLYLSEASEKLNSELEKMLTLSQIISQNSLVREFLEKKDKDISFSEEYDDADEILKTIDSIKSFYQIEEIQLYIDESFMFSRSQYVLYNLENIKDKDWYKQILDQRVSAIVRPPYPFKYPLVGEKEIMSVSSVIRSYNDIDDILGAVSIDVSLEKVINLVKSADFTKSGAVLILDPNGKVIATNNNTGADISVYSDILEETLKKYPNGMGITKSGTLVAGISKPTFGNLRVFSLTPMQTLLSESFKLKWQLIIFATSLGVVVYFMAFFYSKFYTKRVKDLAVLMHNAEKGDFQARCIIDSSDEIGDLQSSFNFMTQHINDLLIERYDLGKNLKSTELKALQAQINPHFLYNTLDLISWKAKAANNNEISDIVCKMANFYQLSLSNGSDFIKLSSEFEHIRLYIALQNLRFEKKVELITLLDPEIENQLIMKLLLQPIVENSLSHGIMDLDGERPGVIKIRAYLEDDYINIIIADNGVGMNKKKLVEILTHDKSALMASPAHGFGLLNIIDRLKLYHNNNYSFNIESVPNNGTTVYIKIPYSKNNERTDEDL